MKQKYIHENFPIDTDVAQTVYNIVSDAIYKHPGIRQSGLYGVRPFYHPEDDEMVPILFGTLFSRDEYAEIIFSKIKNKENGKLEVKLFGKNQERLSKIKFKIENKVKEELESINK